jgi:HSP20 family protein
MAIERWNPFRDIFTLQDRMNDLFSSTLRGCGEEGVPATRAGWAPSVDICEDGNNLYLEAELPGMTQKDINVKLENSTLTIQGERKWEKEDKKENYHRVERAYGSFMRSFTVPTSVDGEKVQASYRDGILKVTMPKRPESKPREISVKISG